MNTYTVVNISSGEEVYRYVEDSPIEWIGMEFSTHTHSIWIDPSDPVVATVVPVKIWEPLQYMRRFTSNERKAIWSAQTSNADIDDGIRLLMAAPSVHNNDTDVIRLTHAFEALGLIGAGRAEEILNGN